MKQGRGVTIDDILSEREANGNPPVSVKDSRGLYMHANTLWSELAEATVHKIVGKRDDQLPWGPTNAQFIEFMDKITRQQGRFESTDRRPHFQQQVWLRSTIEKIYIPGKGVVISTVNCSTTDDFCRLANAVTESGLEVNGHLWSVRQLYLMHQLLFHVPHKLTARELGCTTSRIQQHLQEIRDHFGVDDTKELICALSVHGLFPLLEHFDLLFRHQWLSDELKHH